MSLTEMATQKILAQIREGEYREAQRLPPEKEIALQIGVSRTVVRDAMAVLEREGFISRKHGLGTVINRHVIAITNRMDLEQEFCEEVRAAALNRIPGCWRSGRGLRTGRSAMPCSLPRVPQSFPSPG